VAGTIHLLLESAAFTRCHDHFLRQTQGSHPGQSPCREHAPIGRVRGAGGECAS
jgi:hypothetical protein